MSAVQQLLKDWFGQSFSWNETPVPIVFLHLAQSIDSQAGSVSATGITSNATGSLGAVPANAFLTRLLLRNTTANAVNVTLGTTSGGSDVAPSSGPLTVVANGTLTVDITNFLLGWFSATAPQQLWIASSSWGGASINAKLDYEVGP